MLFIFFFKQKTAYELRISDWSSDVCSSDLARKPSGRHRLAALQPHEHIGEASTDVISVRHVARATIDRELQPIDVVGAPGMRGAKQLQVADDAVIVAGDVVIERANTILPRGQMQTRLQHEAGTAALIFIGNRDRDVCRLRLAIEPDIARNTDARLIRLFDIHRRSEEHTSELQSLMRISYAVFCLKKKKKKTNIKRKNRTNTSKQR